MPSLKGMMRAKQAKITHWTAKDIEAEADNIGLTGSPTQVVKIFTPIPRAGGQMLQGEPSEIAEKLISLIKDELH
jgi:electron transfer flavoprotein beta subunit